MQHLGGLGDTEMGDREDQECPHGLWVMVSPRILCVELRPGSPSVLSPWAAPQHGDEEGGGDEDGDGDQGGEWG